MTKLQQFEKARAAWRRINDEVYAVPTHRASEAEITRINDAEAVMSEARDALMDELEAAGRTQREIARIVFG